MRTKIQIFGRIALVVALLLTAFAFAAPAQAQTKFTSYISGVQVANLSSTTEANVLLTAYSAATGLPDGSPLTDKIPANSSKTYFPISNVSSGFSGSLVISSDQTVAAISNILSSAGTPAGASYVGRSTGDQTVLLPLLVKDNAGFTTWYSVQNAGTGDASVSVAYSDGTNVAASTIKQGASKIYYQSQETHTSPVFAATITSDKPIVAAVIQESTDIIFSYTGFASTAASTAPVFPLVNANNAGFVTGIQIQNAGTQATSVDADLYAVQRRHGMQRNPVDTGQGI